MKHQITFVGGQLLPVLLGIKEFSPDKIDFIVSSESKSKIGLIQPFLIGKKQSETLCNPFDYASIKAACERIIDSAAPEDEIQFNLTGGTKIMVLAAQSLILNRSLAGFYINQDDTLLKLPSYSIHKITCQISVKEFLEVSGHKLSSSKMITDFSADDLKVAGEIDNFSMLQERLFYQVNSKFRNTYNNIARIPVSGQVEVSKSVRLNWIDRRITIDLNGKEIFSIQSPNARNLFFNAAWWELIVAREISKWSKAKELLIQCELPFKTDALTTKNEIDVLINLGSKLIFVECKSGTVKQEDINKMRIIKDTYGGVISKSLLVSRFVPSSTILEKCKELNIEVFYCFMGKNQVNPINRLINALDKLERKLAI